MQNLTYSKDALEPKFKLLIALVIDAEHGAVQGAIALGYRAIDLGASTISSFETLRVAYQICGNRALFTSAQVLYTLFKLKESANH